MTVKFCPFRKQRGLTLLGLLLWAILVGAVVLLGMQLVSPVNEYFTIKRAVAQVADSGATSVPEVRAAFDRQKDIEYSIASISGKDLMVTKENERIVVKFAYTREIELISPVFLLLKFEGSSKSGPSR